MYVLFPDDVVLGACSTGVGRGVVAKSITGVESIQLQDLSKI